MFFGVPNPAGKANSYKGTYIMGHPNSRVAL